MTYEADHRSDCMRCGTCCRKGGPALHQDDKSLVLNGRIPREKIVTIRKGEFAYSPESGNLVQQERELLKISGKGIGWSCCYFDLEKVSCIIYGQRPLECRVLECRRPARLLAIAGKDLLARADFVKPDEPIMHIINLLERECPVGQAEGLVLKLQKNTGNISCISELRTLLDKDISIRSEAVAKVGLSLGAELFFFGRPLFKILGARGVKL